MAGLDAIISKGTLILTVWLMSGCALESGSVSEPISGCAALESGCPEVGVDAGAGLADSGILGPQTDMASPGPIPDVGEPADQGNLAEGALDQGALGQGTLDQGALDEGGQGHRDQGHRDQGTHHQDMGDASASSDVMIRTRFGRIILRLNTEQAPVTANNFLQYIDDGFFDGRDGGGPTILHRVIGDFMIQGGGFLANGGRKRTRGPIILESMNGLLNRRGTIAMARTGDPNSATSQFFINHVDNDFLNHRPGSDGYAVFGEVIEGMEVVDAIAAVATDAQDIPIEPVIIEEAIRWIED